jgi:hypothetical protein
LFYRKTIKDLERMKFTGARRLSSHVLVLLNILWYAIAIVLVVSVVVVGLSFFKDVPGLEMTAIPPSFGVNADASGWKITIPVSLRMDDAHAAASPGLGIGGAEIQDLRGALRFPIRRGPLFVANSLVLMVALAVTLWLVRELQGVLRTVRDGHPFVATNAARVRTIGWIVIGSELARAAIVFLENYYAMQNFAAEGLQFTAHPDLSLFALVEGCIILVIAEVFRAGTRLDDEQSLTV